MNHANTYHNGRHKPDNGRQEAESLGRLPASADSITTKAPGPDAAAWQVVNSVDQDTESSKPGKGNQNIP
jgi:hypothetical protein